MSLEEALANYVAEGESEGQAAEGVQQPDTTAAEPAPTDPAGDTPVATPQSPAQPDASSPADLFSEAALATPQGIAAARTELQRLNEESRTKRQKLDSRESKFAQTRDRHLNEYRAYQADKQQFLANLNTLRSAPYEQRLLILSQLMNDQPHEIVRQLNLSALKKGKPPDAIAELTSIVQGLKSQLESQTNAQRQEAEDRQAEAAYKAELPAVIQAPEFLSQHPAIADYIQRHPAHLPEVVDTVTRLRQDYFKKTAGQPLDEGLAFLQVEQHLRRLPKPPAAPPPAAVAPVTTPQSPAPKPPLTGQSLTAPEAVTQGSRREMSEEESIEAIANDPDAMAWLRKAGLVR